MVDPDTDAERDLIAKDLSKAGVVISTDTVKSGEPYRLKNRVIGGFLVADGDLTICELKDRQTAA
jgi:hypothetical protein